MTTTTAIADSLTRTPGPWRPPGRLTAHWLVTSASFVCYVLSHVMVGGGAVPTLLEIGGVAACGWSWLLARALFDPAGQDSWWPRIVVFVVFASGALSVLGIPGDVGRVLDNAYALSGSAVLLLTFVEPFHRYRRDLPASEKRFRFAFVAVYALLVAISILGPDPSGATAAEAYRIDVLKSLCALGGLITGTAAVWFRVRHPLARGGPASRRPPTMDDRRIADRLLDLLTRDGAYAEPNLKVADVAARLGEPEYRISQCITAVLGFDNFNRLINHHRVELAKRLLVDPGRRLSILEISFECGFGSVGPFNRAFKAGTGLTPRAFRAAHRQRS